MYAARGALAESKGDLEGAIADYRRAMECSKNTKPYMEKTSFEGGNVTGFSISAEDDFDIAEITPKVALTYVEMGKREQTRGRLPLASANYNRAIELDPKCSAAYYQRATVERENGNLDAAIADCNRALELNPKHPQACYIRGTVRRTKDDIAGSLEDFSRAIEISPKMALAWYARGSVRKYSGDAENAVADFSRAIELDSKLVQAYRSRAAARIMQCDYLGALADCHHCCESSPSDQGYSRVYICLSRARMGQIDAASEELSSYLAQRPSSELADWSSSIGAYLVGKMPAESFLASAADLKQTQGPLCEAYFYVGIKHLLAGETSTAADYFRRSLGTGQKDLAEYGFAGAELKALPK